VDPPVCASPLEAPSGAYEKTTVCATPEHPLPHLFACDKLTSITSTAADFEMQKVSASYGGVRWGLLVSCSAKCLGRESILMLPKFPNRKSAASRNVGDSGSPRFTA